MGSGVDPTDFQLPHTEKIEWMIEQAGWALEPVGPRRETVPPTPAYSYTIGLPGFVGFPEIVVCGLTPVASRGLVGMIVDLLVGGTEIPVDANLVGILDGEQRCRFAPVDVTIWGAMFPAAVEFHGDAPWDLVQLMYPDRAGFLPYEAGFERRLRFAQPVLGRV